MIPEPQANAEPPRVLVVEDEVLVRTLVAEALRNAGCEVIEAGEADEALAFIEAGGQVDLVFSDVQLPGVASGADLAARLRRLDPGLPVFLTSAAALPAHAAGLGRFIPKPYDLQRVVGEISAALGRPPPPAAGR